MSINFEEGLNWMKTPLGNSDLVSDLILTLSFQEWSWGKNVIFGELGLFASAFFMKKKRECFCKTPNCSPSYNP